LIYQVDTAAEKKEIVKRYRKLITVWKPKSPEDKDLVRKAFKLAADAHKDMRRRSGEPYIYHPLSVATIAAGEIGLGTTSIICSLLHDVVEDTEYTLEDISDLFGEKVASIIDGLTKIKGIFDQKTASIQAENFKKLLLTLSDDVRVILVKLADRLHNMRTLDAISKDKQLKVSSETLHLYAPLANRLGLHAIKSELQDLALKHTDQEIYESISRKLRETAKIRSEFITQFLEPLKKSLHIHGINYHITSREKSIYSIWEKMQNKEVTFEEIYDIFAIRIVIDTPLDSEKTECWKAYSIITDHYRPNMDRLRDWISNPKANGYEALHTTVMSHTGKWVEIQIRSKRMDEIAEKGYAAHWKYKESLNINSRLDNWLDRIREMIESPEADALSFIDDVKGYFFLDEISVFTPQGELRTLPANSTVLDFAFAIHSEVGNTCIGAKVDKKLVPITHLLRNGEQIELITSKKQTPKEEWLNYVVTTRAKSNIKMALKKEKKRYFKHGKEKIEKWFDDSNISFTNENIRNFLSSTNYETLVDLYYAASHDKFGPKEVKQFVAANEKTVLQRFIDLLPLRKTPSETKKNDKKEPMPFLAGIKITGIDKIGLINDITRIISSNMSLNIKSFNLYAQDGLTEGEVMLYLNDPLSLKKLLINLKRVEGIKTVNRIS
jgi:GTP diphosphokinase / guanosine-3',5'-bis(diphosphate) 3'-diphosphatase